MPAQPGSREAAALARIFNGLSGLGLIVGTVGFVVLLCAWLQEWPAAVVWTVPGAMGGAIGVAARVVARRYELPAR